MRSLYLVPSMVALLLAGCSGPPSLSGTVTFDNAPLAEATIVLTPMDREAELVVGTTRPDGSFLITPAAGKSIARGTYKMTVSKPVQTPEQRRAMLPGTESIPARYSDPQKSELTVKVPPDGELKFDLTR